MKLIRYIRYNVFLIENIRILYENIILYIHIMNTIKNYNYYSLVIHSKKINE